MRPDELSLEEALVASTAVANYRKGQEMDKVVFSVNVPEVVAIKGPGRRVESRYSEFEVLFSLIDGRCLYASPALAAKIEALAPAVGEFFSVCKAEVRDGQRKRIEWQVAPAESGQWPVASGQTTPATPPPPAPASRPGPRPVPAKAPEPVSAPAAPVSQANSMTQIMSGALVAAIDALAEAAAYAREKHNWELMFGADDVRSCAASCFIQWWKDRETRARYGGTTAPERVNGGAAWQQ